MIWSHLILPCLNHFLFLLATCQTGHETTGWINGLKGNSTGNHAAVNTIFVFLSRGVRLDFPTKQLIETYLTGAKRREFSGMIHFITSNNHPSNPQQPIHSLRFLRLAPVSIETTETWCRQKRIDTVFTRVQFSGWHDITCQSTHFQRTKVPNLRVILDAQVWFQKKLQYIIYYSIILVYSVLTKKTLRKPATKFQHRSFFTRNTILKRQCGASPTV